MYGFFECISISNDILLFSLAVLICLFSCFTTATLLDNAQRNIGRECLFWMILAAIEFGMGIWSVHSIAIITYDPSINILYDIFNVILSAAIAIFGSFISFASRFLLRSPKFGRLCGGILLTVTLISMHQAGIESVRIPGGTQLDEPLLPVALLISCILCAVGLWRLASRHAVRRLEVMVWLSAATCLVPFSGMTALRFHPGPAMEADFTTISSQTLAINVGAETFALLIISLTVLFISRFVSKNADRELYHMRQLASVSFEGLVIHREGVILDVNQQFCDLIGSNASELIGTQLISLIAPNHVPEILKSMQLPPSLQVSPETTVITKQGLLAVEFRIRLIDYYGRSARAISVRDLTERRTSEAQLHYLAHHDGLTGLPNRMLFKERLSHALEIAQHHNHCVAVLCLDLDRFKPINDLLGHAAGDQLLVQVADRLSGVLRAGDVPSRLGGDEFAVLLSVLNEPETGTTLAQRIVEGLSQPFEISGQHVTVGVSIGISLAPTHGADGETLLRLADVAMYQAKKTRGSYCLFQPAMDKQLQNRRLLELNLIHSVESA